MNWRIYQCDTCGLILGVGKTFPDGGGVGCSHVVEQGMAEVHEGATLYETPNAMPLHSAASAAAMLDWARDEIADDNVTEVIP